MSVRTSITAVFASTLLFTLFASSAANDLPEPMTLAYALSRAEHHPALQESHASLGLAEADVLSSDASNDLSVYLQGRLQWIGPSERALDQSHDDHKISLNLRKTLYDFGRTDAKLEAAERAVSAKSSAYHYKLGLLRIDIMRRYFDVLLSDLEFIAENEAISIAFIRADKAEQRLAFGELSELEVIDAQAAYQSILADRNAAEMRQRSTRAYFAEAINHPGKLSEVFEAASTNDVNNELPDYQQLLDLAIKQHQGLQALEAALLGLQEKERLSRRVNNPTLSAYGELADYSRVESGTDEWQLGLSLKVPLYEGRRKDAALAKVKAEQYRVQAQRAELRAEIRQQLLELWQEVQILKQRLAQLDLQLDSRDLYLDKARALYQMEVRSDLGDAMIRYSRTKFERAKIVYRLLIAKEKIKLLTASELQVPTPTE